MQVGISFHLKEHLLTPPSIGLSGRGSDPYVPIGEVQDPSQQFAGSVLQGQNEFQHQQLENPFHSDQIRGAAKSIASQGAEVIATAVKSIHNVRTSSLVAPRKTDSDKLADFCEDLINNFPSEVRQEVLRRMMHKHCTDTGVRSQIDEFATSVLISTLRGRPDDAAGGQ